MAKKRTELCPLAKTFSKKLAEVRKSHQMTQHELAEKVGLSRGMITYYESLARNPTLDTVYRIANYFDLPPEDFIVEEGDEKKIESRSFCKFVGGLGLARQVFA